MQQYQAAGHTAVPTDAGYGANRAAQPVNPTNAQTAAAVAARNSNPAAAGAFNSSWYGAHPDAWHATGWAAGDEWHTGSWAAVAPAVGMSAAVQPVPYNYGGYAGTLTGPSPPTTQPPTSPDQNYNQASTLAQTAAPPSPQSGGWTPLGVFALVRNQESTPHLLMQLAVNKSVALAGNYTDLVTDTIQPVQGSVDKQSQRVAWTVGSNKQTVGEAGLYNLTQDVAPAIIHVGPDKMQQWLLVRMKQAASTGGK